MKIKMLESVVNKKFNSDLYLKDRIPNIDSIKNKFVQHCIQKSDKIINKPVLSDYEQCPVDDVDK